MESKAKFQRTFMIFGQEERGYGSGQEPSGYVKIEINNGKGKLDASIQNLKYSDRIEYRLYLISYKDAAIQSAVPVALLQVPKGRVEVKLDFNPSDVLNSGFNILAFNIAAVIGFTIRGGGRTVCPMAAYRDGKVSWLGCLGEIAYEQQKKSAAADNNIQLSLKKMEEKPLNVHIHDNIEQKKETLADELEKVQKEDLKDVGKEEVDNNKEEVVEGLQQELEAEQIDLIKEELNNEFKVDQQELMESQVDYDLEVAKTLGVGDIPACGKKIGVAPYNNYSTGFCIPHNTTNPASPCHSCSMSNSARTANEKAENTDIKNLKIYFDKFFEAADPFRSRRKDYQWWKVGSPVQLNNILYQCNLKTPLLFNPSIMMAHFKYRHLIIGIYTDKIRNREYVVCGVPGVLKVDEKPFGDLCRWVQVEGNRPRYGAFGYWLVYIDGKSGKLINMN